MVQDTSKSENETDFPTGSRVYWQRTQRGDQGLVSSAAVVTGEKGSLREIEIRGRPGLLLPAIPANTLVSVDVLRARNEPSYAFGEPMTGEYLGHVIEAVQVDPRTTQSAPFGLWVGKIKGYTVTLGCNDPDAAYRQAVLCLETHEYARMLEAGIQKVQSRRPTNWAQEAAELRALLDLAPKPSADITHPSQTEPEELELED